ncbi:hypothetical protein JW960_06890 [candidate division KSB1 bacterium]|nr:hypothetical protein [candidate division KSB1 bacterium]
MDISTFAASRSQNERLVIAPGFCMKPYDIDAKRCLCPAGHFNHRCLMAERSDFIQKAQLEWPLPCSSCDIGTLVHHAARIGADVYIMTSGVDIARDLYLPAAHGTGARLGLFFLCRYSMEAFTWGMLISGMQGAAIPFCMGDCLNHHDFTQADKGIKESQTHVDTNQWQNILTILKQLPGHQANNEVLFEYVKSVYLIMKRCAVTESSCGK